MLLNLIPIKIKQIFHLRDKISNEIFPHKISMDLSKVERNGCPFLEKSLAVKLGTPFFLIRNRIIL